ncbi:hypothetical protein GCM10027596_12950 [Nocardioides korecus]
MGAPGTVRDVTSVTRVTEGAEVTRGTRASGAAGRLRDESGTGPDRCWSWGRARFRTVRGQTTRTTIVLPFGARSPDPGEEDATY